MPDRPTAPPSALPNPLRTLRPRAKPKQTEASEQRALFQFLRYWAYREPRFGFVFAIPNGGKRDGATAAQMYLTGVLAGVWDIFCPVRSEKPLGDNPADGTFVEAGLWIEMKSATGSLSAEQRKFPAFVEKQGFRCSVCRDWLSAAQIICNHLDVTDEAILCAIAVNEKGPRPVKGAVSKP